MKSSLLPATAVDYIRSMKIIEFVRTLKGLGIRELGRAVGEDHTKILYWEKQGHKMSEFIGFVCKLRRVSGLSWSKFGSMLDTEFLGDWKRKEEKRK